MSVYRVVGYREDAGGASVGPQPIRQFSNMSEAKSFALACLWFERDGWCAVAICRDDWSEVARYRRFPPGRLRPEKDLTEVVWGQVPWRKRTKGARLAIGGTGSRLKSFGGGRNGRSGFEGV